MLPESPKLGKSIDMPEFVKQKNKGRYGANPRRFVSSVEKDGLSNVMDFFKKGNDARFFDQKRVESPRQQEPYDNYPGTKAPYYDQKGMYAKIKAQ